jgi:DMSO/TMAO reductase YedYZ molybdopterin-dependent catalytic subunit
MRTIYRFLLVTIILPALVAGCATNASAPTALPPTEASTPAASAPSPTEGPTPAPTPSSMPLTPVDKLGRTGTPVKVDIEKYRLVVDGLVEHPLSLSYDELLAYPAVSEVLTLVCPGFFTDYAEWTGPVVRTLLEQAGVKPGASQVVFYDGGSTPYQQTLALETALLDDTLLAYKVNGVTLPVEHGYPVRLAVGSELGSYWVKWLFRIEVQ